MLYKLSKGVNKLANKKDINENINESDKVFRKVVLSWYPGHMAKTRRQITEDLKLVDIVIELLDARIPISSQNPNIAEITKNKKKIIVLNKCDLADDIQNKKWVEYFKNKGIIAVLVDSNSGKGIENCIKEIENSMKEELEVQAAKGRTGRRIKAMILGIPNVGKSSFINRIAKRTTANVGNKPGVTKQKQWIRINEKIELLDTPGVLWPKFEDQQVGLKLALLGSVKDQVVNMDDLALFACEYLMQEKPEIFDIVYHVKIADTPYETLQNIAIKRGYLLKGEIDENRLMLSFVKDIRENKCGLITWEKPHVG